MRKVVALGIAILGVLLVSGLGAWYILSPMEYRGAPEPITVAYSPFESTALFWIAEDQRFFDENGINVTIRKYDSGVATLEGMARGEADVAVGISEYPLVTKAFQGAKIRALGNIDKGDFIYLVGRRDRGIGDVADLRGKRVGTTFGTIAEFHLGRFLTLHGMDIGDVTLVDVRTPAGWVNAVADGDVDAISTAQPYAYAARDRLGANAIIWPAQSSQPLYALVVSTSDWIDGHPGQVTRFLQALAKAEEYTSAHPAEAKAIVQQRLGLDPGYMDTVWQQNQYSLTLDQSLILAMEDEARWMIANNMTDEAVIPDFRNYIYTGGLESVKPGSVNIIR
jgi:NitT/TauT family transport system substrate-binding protein